MESQLHEIQFRSSRTQIIAEFLPRNADSDPALFKDLPINK